MIADTIPVAYWRRIWALFMRPLPTRSSVKQRLIICALLHLMRHKHIAHPTAPLYSLFLPMHWRQNLWTSQFLSLSPRATVRYIWSTNHESRSIVRTASSYAVTPLYWQTRESLVDHLKGCKRSTIGTSMSSWRCVFTFLFGSNST